MKNKFRLILLMSIVTILFSCSKPTSSNDEPLVKIERTQDRGYKVDERSYNLGMLTGFAELIDFGLKNMAFSNSFSPADMDIIYPDIQKIASNNHIEVYRDPTPLSTELFSFDAGNEVVILHSDPKLIEEYLRIKSAKNKMLKNGSYQTSGKFVIARRLGQLLSYSDASIDKMLKLDSSQTEPATHTNIRQELNDWVKMWNTFDYDEVERLFLNSDELSYFSSEKEGIITGLDGVKKHYQGFGFKSGGTSPLTKLWLEDIAIVNQGEMATVTAIWFFQRTDGRTQKGPVTIVYQKEDDRYLIAHMNFSNYKDSSLPEQP